jgi:hypothetical protein
MRVEALNISPIAPMYAITFLCLVFALLRCYAPYVGGCLPTFQGKPYRSHLQGSSSPETPVNTYIRCVTSQKGEGLNYTTAKA